MIVTGTTRQTGSAAMADPNDTPQAAEGRPLRVGIIGLGRRWHQRYKPALLALGDRYQISAVCDQVAERGNREGRRLGCPSLAGPAELMQRRDTDALLLIDPQWYRLWPVEAACRLGKPCFCSDALERDDAHADRVYRQVRDSGVLVSMALPFRSTPAALTLQELLGKRGAEVRLVQCSTAHAFPRRQSAGQAGPAMALPCSLALLDWCTSFLAGTPSHILAAGLPGNSLSTLLLRYGDGRAVQITRHQAPAPMRVLRRLQVITDRGSALVRLPAHIHWSDSQGMYLPRPRQRPPAEQVLLEQFHRAVTQGNSMTPDIAHVFRLLGWWRLAVRSLREGRWLEVPETCPS